MSTLLFGSVVLVVLVVLHAYLWWRLVAGTTRPGALRRVLTATTATLAVLPVLAITGREVLPWEVQTPLDWVGYTWLGLAFYAFLALLALEPVRAVLARWPRRRHDHAPNGAPEVPTGADAAGGTTADPARSTEAPAGGPLPRRLFLARSAALTAGLVAVSTAGTGVVLANSSPVVRRVPIRMPRLDPALDGYRIVTFSDAHLSPTYGGRRFERLVDLVNAQQPDVVAVVGDLVDGELSDLREDVAPLQDLVTRQGAYFVTGNHEYLVDTTAWLRHLPTLGVEVLRNERVVLGRGGAVFDLAGIDDRTAAGSGVPGHGADLDAALDGRDDAVPVVLLAHQPVQVDQARAARVDLQLSGHTHGGQLWPFDLAVRLDQPAVEGLSRVGDTQLYVTAGAGYWGPPMRIGARPEVTVIELVQG